MPGQAWKRVVFVAVVLTFLGASAGVAFGLARPSARPVADQRHDTAAAAAVPSGGAQQRSGDASPVTPGPSAASSGDGTGDTSGNTGGNTNGGNGTTTTKVSVPGVNGLAESDARTQLKNKGLGVTVKYSCDGSADPGKVGYQNPYSGTSVGKGTKVALTVGGVQVPDVTGQDHADGRSQLEALGLKVSENDPQSGTAGGAVSRQGPSGGSCVKPGSTVTLWVGTPSSPQAEGSPDPVAS